MSNNLDINSRRKALGDLLKCTICQEVAVFPILNCVPNGHIICGICKEKVKKCGVCRSPISPSVFAEALSNKAELTVCCPNFGSGCILPVKCSEMKAHLANCYFREAVCIMVECGGAKFSFPDFCQHLKEKHLLVAQLGKPFSFFFTKTIKAKDSYLSVIFVEFESEIFCSQIMASSKYKSLFTWMTVLGDKEKAKKYKYKFQIIKENNVRSWTFPVLPHHDYKHFMGPSQFYVTSPLENLFSDHPSDKSKLTLDAMVDIET